MPMKEFEDTRYTNVAIALHWLIALAVLGLIGLGWYMADIPKGTPERTYWFNLHKSIGVTVGVLVLVRLLWRLTHRPPPLPLSMSRWEAAAARLNHAVLYACLLIMPITGFVASNFSKFGVKYFGLQIGPLFPESQATRDALQEVHELVSYVLVALVVLHVLAALKHLLMDRDKVFQRMLPGRSAAR
jgi:cytochrome b561